MSKVKDFFAARYHSFGHAFRGWGVVLRTQPNTWIHAFITVAVFLTALWLKLPVYHWAVVLVMTAVVWAAEFINTAIEAVVDLVSPEEHPLAKVSKDVSAAAVLITALIAVLVGLLILGPPLWSRLSTIFTGH
jgi:diacylglycerol kinase (ATP)